MKIFVLLMGFLFLLSACAPPKGPLRVAEMCLVDQQDALRFVEEMKKIAEEEKMDFVDGSDESKRGLEIIGYQDRGRANGSPTIHIAVQRSDGMGVTAANIGLADYQIALGFTERPSRAEATRFSDKVLKRLARFWHVKVLPVGTVGVLPNPDCK